MEFAISQGRLWPKPNHVQIEIVVQADGQLPSSMTKLHYVINSAKQVRRDVGKGLFNQC